MRQKNLLLTITIFFFLATTFQWTYGQTTNRPPENTDKPVEVVPGVTLQDLAEFPEDVSFFIVAGGFGLLVGIPTGLIGGPIVGSAAGAAAMGMAAYRMDVNRFLYETVGKPLNEYAQREYGRDMTEEEWRQIKEKFNFVTTRHGLTNAVPEAAGRLENDRISTLAIMTGSAILYLIMYISVPLIIRYGHLKRPVKTRKNAIFILIPLFIAFSYHVHTQKTEAQKEILEQIGAPDRNTTPGMIGSPLLYGAMAASYFILRRKNRLKSSNNDDPENHNTEKQALPVKQAAFSPESTVAGKKETATKAGNTNHIKIVALIIGLCILVISMLPLLAVYNQGYPLGHPYTAWIFIFPLAGMVSAGTLVLFAFFKGK